MADHNPVFLASSSDFRYSPRNVLKMIFKCQTAFSKVHLLSTVKASPSYKIQQFNLDQSEDTKSSQQLQMQQAYSWCITTYVLPRGKKKLKMRTVRKKPSRN